MTASAKEMTVQFKVSPALKKDIYRRALERDETVRVYILKALQSQGIEILDTDLVDRRKAASQ